MGRQVLAISPIEESISSKLFDYQDVLNDWKAMQDTMPERITLSLLFSGYHGCFTVFYKLHDKIKKEELDELGKIMVWYEAHISDMIHGQFDKLHFGE